MADVPSISYRTIRKLAAELAGHLLPILRARPSAPPAHLNSEKKLTAILAPAVAAFAGRLMTLTPEQAGALSPVLRRFFGDAATAAAIERYATGDTAAAEELYERLLTAGLRDTLAARVYFTVALDSLLAAAEAVVWRDPPGPSLEQDETPSVVALFLGVGDAASPYLFAAMKEFVAAVATRGLGRVELGQAVAPDGEIIFYWDPAPMAGAPPHELAQSAGPDEFLSESNGGGVESLDAAEEAREEEPPLPPPSPPPPPPPSPLPLTGPTETAVALRLDAALPERVTVGRAFDLAVAIRQPASPPLAPDDLARRESGDFGVVWPSDAAFVQLRIQIGAPDCIIHGGDSRSVRLPAGGDGPPVYFQLTPQLAGPLSVIITVYQEADWVGSTRLRTEAGAGEARGQLAMTVESRPLGNGEVNLVTLRRALDDGYTDSELRDLCFELGIDYEDLPGDNQSAKARELVLYAKRRDLTASLVELVMKARPHLLAPA